MSGLRRVQAGAAIPVSIVTNRRIEAGAAVPVVPVNLQVGDIVYGETNPYPGIALELNGQSVARADYPELSAMFPAHNLQAGMLTKFMEVTVGYVRMAYGNGVFVGIRNTAPSGKVAVSSDGWTWTEYDITFTGATSLNNIAFGAGLFVVVGQTTNNVYTSPDGINWTVRVGVLPSSSSWSGLVFAGGKFVSTFVNSTNGAQSVDGITWTATVAPANFGAILFWAGTHFVSCGTGLAYVLYADSATLSWVQKTLPLVGTYSGGVGVGNRWILHTNTILVYSDNLGTTWNKMGFFHYVTDITRMLIVANNVVTITSRSILYTPTSDLAQWREVHHPSGVLGNQTGAAATDGNIVALLPAAERIAAVSQYSATNIVLPTVYDPYIPNRFAWIVVR